VPATIVPAAVVARAQRLRRANVIGVAWGDAQVGGAWTGERIPSVHVRRKRHPSELGPGERVPSGRGRRVDVLEVSHLRQLQIDCGDPVTLLPDPARGASAISLCARSGRHNLVLVSGHGALPLVRGKLPALYDAAVDGPAQLSIVDDAPRVWSCEIEQGRIDDRCDFAVARVPGDIQLLHYAAAAQAPIRVRTDPLVLDQPLRQFAPTRRRAVEGQLKQVMCGLAWVPGVGGQKFPYRDVLIASARVPGHGPFSRPGDSGSLVVDDAGQCVGFVVAGDPVADVTYVLPPWGAIAALGSAAQDFFTW